MLPDTEHAETLRHLEIDGCPATVFTVRAGSVPRTELVVSVPGRSLQYTVTGNAEAANFALIDREMQALISSFHVEKVPTPKSGKR